MMIVPLLPRCCRSGPLHGQRRAGQDETPGRARWGQTRFSGGESSACEQAAARLRKRSSLSALQRGGYVILDDAFDAEGAAKLHEGSTTVRRAGQAHLLYVSADRPAACRGDHKFHVDEADTADGCPPSRLSLLGYQDQLAVGGGPRSTRAHRLRATRQRRRLHEAPRQRGGDRRRYGAGDRAGFTRAERVQGTATGARSPHHLCHRWTVMAGGCLRIYPGTTEARGGARRARRPRRSTWSRWRGGSSSSTRYRSTMRPASSTDTPSRSGCGADGDEGKSAVVASR